MRQQSLFEDQRMTQVDSIAMSLASLLVYGPQYRHWGLAYSGGKDSTALVTLVMWLIRTGQLPAPKTLTVMYADTRLELPPLQQAAMRLLDILSEQGIDTRVVMPELDRRYFVYMLGRGVPPPKNRFRWCTPMLKVEPMMLAMGGLRETAGEKVLMLTGVRLGESAARDQRIALSCSKDSGECGQGWYQIATPESVADTLAPLLHWRLCHVYDWLYLNDDHGYPVDGIAAVYGQDEVRTGCVGCNLTEHDTALDRLLKRAQWEHLRPLKELKPLYRELQKAKWRKRKTEPELRQDGQYGRNAQRLGPLTMEARAMGLEKVLDIQRRAGVDLINSKEEARIREMWALDIWPRKWSADDAAGNQAVDAIRVLPDGQLVRQALLMQIGQEAK